MKLDANYIQGIPDIGILYYYKWVALEFKRDKSASVQPNQEYWVDKLNELSYSSFIYPENEEEVIYEIQQLFGTRE